MRARRVLTHRRARRLAHHVLRGRCCGRLCVGARSARRCPGSPCRKGRLAGRRQYTGPVGQRRPDPCKLGFRRGYQCSELITILLRLTERCAGWSSPLCLCQFDSPSVYDCMNNQAVHKATQGRTPATSEVIFQHAGVAEAPASTGCGVPSSVIEGCYVSLLVFRWIVEHFGEVPHFVAQRRMWETTRRDPLLFRLGGQYLALGEQSGGIGAYGEFGYPDGQEARWPRADLSKLHLDSGAEKGAARSRRAGRCGQIANYDRSAGDGNRASTQGGSADMETIVYIGCAAVIRAAWTVYQSKKALWQVPGCIQQHVRILHYGVFPVWLG